MARPPAHLTALAQSRRVLLYETRGQGGAFAAADAAQADVTNCSLPRHAEDFASVLRASGLAAAGECDVCAFSFGGRVAMAAAALADISPARTQNPKTPFHSEDNIIIIIDMTSQIKRMQ